MSNLEPKKRTTKRFKHVVTPKTRKIVYKGVDDGLNLREIGEQLDGISAITVKKYYEKEIKHYKRGEGSSVVAYQVNPDDRTTVENMVLAGFEQSYISECIGISLATLKQYYREELTQYLAKRVGGVARQLVDQAERGDKWTNGNAIFVLKCKANWRDNEDREIADSFTDTMKDVVERLPD